MYILKYNQPPYNISTSFKIFEDWTVERIAGNCINTISIHLCDSFDIQV